jgi:hypothetical protein
MVSDYNIYLFVNIMQQQINETWQPSMQELQQVK